MKKLKRNKGITLVALIVTIIVLLILAGISLNAVFSQDGIFSRAENAGNKYNEAKAREVLETVLLGDGQYEKHSNPKYNQDDYLDELITNEIPEAEIRGDIVIIGDYGFELDRSVPKIGRTILNPKDLILPAVTVAEVTHADASDNRIATINITATIDAKAKNGINRIEIWQGGTKQATIPCTNEYSVTTTYKANKNGKYTIKAYTKIDEKDIAGSGRTTVEGIVPAVEFTPNGSTDWKKSHKTTVSVRETSEKVTSMQYLWKKSSEGEPQESDFSQTCTNNSTITGQGETMTGKYCLWVLVTLGADKTYKCGSEEFYFDNENPKITEFLYNPKTATTYNLSCKADDHEGSGIARYEIYMGNERIDQHPSTEKTYTSVDFNEVKDKNTTYKVVVYDKCENNSQLEVTNMEDINIWKKYELIDNSTVEVGAITEGGNLGTVSEVRPIITYWSSYAEFSLDKTGKIVFTHPESGSWYDLVKSGKPAYAIHEWDTGSEIGQIFYVLSSIGKNMNGYESVWANNLEVTKKVQYNQGDFICYENYLKSGTNPTAGNYNGAYYELAE